MAANIPIIPKGNTLHEVISLGQYWYRIYKNPHPVTAREMMFSYGPNRKQYFLFYLPNPSTESREGKARKNKVIVYFHGGGWMLGSPESFRKNAYMLAEEGYPVILPSYRKIPRFNSDQIRQDAFLVVQKSLEILRKHQLEDAELVMAGMSAGANLAAFPFLDSKTREDFDIPKSRLAGLLALGAPLDLSRMNKSLALQLYAGKPDSKQFQKANPISFVDEPAPGPVLCIHGTKDGLVKYDNARYFARLFRQHQEHPLDFVTIEGDTHLDIASWTLYQVHVRQKIFDWLDAL